MDATYATGVHSASRAYLQKTCHSAPQHPEVNVILATNISLGTNALDPVKLHLKQLQDSKAN